MGRKQMNGSPLRKREFAKQPLAASQNPANTFRQNMTLSVAMECVAAHDNEGGFNGEQHIFKQDVESDLVKFLQQMEELGNAPCAGQI